MTTVAKKLMETARVAAEATPSIRYQGVVNKRGQLNTSLQARYFVVLEVTSPQGDVLTDVVVQYFNSKEAFDSNQEPKGSLSCKGMRVKASLKLDGVEGFFFTVIDVNDKEVCCFSNTGNHTAIDCVAQNAKVPGMRTRKARVGLSVSSQCQVYQDRLRTAVEGD